MIPQDQHRLERWQVSVVLTIILIGLLLLTGLSNLAVTLALVVGYVLTLLVFNFWLMDAPDDEHPQAQV